MKDKLKYASVSVNFSDFSPTDNPGFVRGVCKVAYAGKNRNYSDISKEAFENAEGSVFGIPVVGNWLGDNYGGHDILIETKGNDIVFKDKTVPYGFVPQDANPRWVDVEDENGNSKSYYTVDVVLWQERYPEEVQFIIDNGANQSMEIMVQDGDWDDNWDYFEIKDFYYSALCLLGKDEDEDGVKGDNDVEPCFEDADVTIGEFSMSDKFKKDLFAIRTAFEGGEKVEDEKTTTTEIEEFEEDIEDVETEEEIIEENPVEIKKEEESEEVGEVEIAEDVVDGEEETIEEEVVDYELKFNDLKLEYRELAIKVESLEEENKTLSQYKEEKEQEILDTQKDNIISDYALILDEDEISLINSKKSEFSLVELESELSKAFAKNELDKAKSKKTNTKEEIVFDVKNRESKVKKNKFAL